MLRVLSSRRNGASNSLSRPPTVKMRSDRDAPKIGHASDDPGSDVVRDCQSRGTDH